MLAAHIRAALKTFHGFLHQHQALVKEFMDASCLWYLGQSHRNSWAPVPEGWNSHAFCTNLSDTLAGKISDPDFPNLQQIIFKWVRECRQKGPASISQSGIMADLLADTPDPWAAFFDRANRVLGLHPDLRMDPHFPEHFQKLSAPLPLQARMALIKSWGNSWVTTERFHESGGSHVCPVAVGKT